MTLFENGEAVKTIKLEGTNPLVRFINGEIVTVGENAKLTILNTNLETVAAFNGTKSTVYTLTGNREFIAFGDDGGVVRYYNRHANFELKVRKVLRFLFSTIFSLTTIPM